MNKERKIYTLTQLNTSLEKLFWNKFASSNYWITAEIVKITQKNGHFYLELADSSNEQLSARNRGMIWASVYRQMIQDIGLKELKGILKSGNRILMNVKIEYHKLFGLQLKIRSIDPAYSYGEIEKNRREVIKKLQDKLLFNKQKNIYLPLIIKRVSLIGSPDTSGFRDFKNELFNSHEFNQFVIKVFPVRVQGKEAVKDIVEAIKEANNYDSEVIVIIRGGGSKMDLALFDNYAIAKAICLSHLPVLTGIGHETDEVVADLVARQHFITPTAVGHHLHYSIQSFNEIMRSLRDRITQLASDQVNENRNEFTTYYKYLTHYSREIIYLWGNKFQDYEFLIHEKSKSILYQHKDKIATFAHEVSSRLQRLATHCSADISELEFHLLKSSNHLIENEKSSINEYVINKIIIYSQQEITTQKVALETQESLLELLNPIQILKSGYTISTVNGKDVKDTTINIGDELLTLSSNYLIKSKIIQKINQKNEGNE